MSATMPEPTSSTVAGGVFAWKAGGGLIGAAAAGAGLAAIVVMCMTPPRSTREWVVGIISTVLGSITGGAFVIERFQLQQWLETTTGLLSVLGLVFACGVPAWAVVRWTFNWMNKRHAADIGEVLADARRDIAGS